MWSNVQNSWWCCCCCCDAAQRNNNNKKRRAPNELVLELGLSLCSVKYYTYAKKEDVVALVETVNVSMSLSRIQLEWNNKTLHCTALHCTALHCLCNYE